MDLTELYQKGEELLRKRDIGVFLENEKLFYFSVIYE